MRCFVAVKLPDAVRRAMVRAQEELGQAGADVRWVAEDTLHLTVKFLGEVGDETVARFLEQLREEAGRRRPLSVEYAGLGAFPERGGLRTVWAGCRGDLEGLAALVEAVERAGEAAGVPREERPFEPHVTLGRVKSRRGEARLRDLIEKGREAPFGRDDVTSLALVQSTLRPEGPLYETLETIPLAGT